MGLAIFWGDGSCHAASTDRSRVEVAVATYSAAMEKTDRDERVEAYATAAQLFRQIIDGTDDHAPVSNHFVYVNYGNALLQSESLGAAIVAFRRALEMEPSDLQATQNLSYARSTLPSWIRHEPDPKLTDSLFFWVQAVSSQTVSLAAAICFACAVLLGVVGLKKKIVIMRLLAVLPLLAWAILLGGWWMVGASQDPCDVVLVRETAVYSADSENAPLRVSQSLPSGAEVQWVQSRDRWTEIRFAGGKTGWVPSSKIVHLAAYQPE